MVGWQATQKCHVKYIVKKMDFFFRIFLFDTQRFKKVMLRQHDQGASIPIKFKK